MLGQKTESLRSPDDAVRKQYRIVVIDERQLLAECLARCFQERRPHDSVVHFSNVIDWIAASEEPGENSLVILGIGSRRAKDSQVASALTTLQEVRPEIPVIVMADGDDAGKILEALDLGAKGYIPTNVSLSVTVEAIILVAVGGKFIPASSLISSRGAVQSEASAPLPITGEFTARQAAVVEALRKGKANKIIAYELNMRESTVKVHVRNIMKKLKAKNRTEVAFLTQSRMNDGMVGHASQLMSKDYSSEQSAKPN